MAIDDGFFEERLSEIAVSLNRIATGLTILADNIVVQAQERLIWNSQGEENDITYKETEKQVFKLFSAFVNANQPLLQSMKGDTGQ